MGKDNKGRYGYRHRSDDAYALGESAPGTVGDSEGTFHNRATQDNNVIVDGTTRNYEDHKRKQQRKSAAKSTSGNSHSTRSSQHTELVGEVIEVTIDRVSNSGNPIAEHNGTHVHVQGAKPGQTVTIEITRASSSYLTGRLKQTE